MWKSRLELGQNRSLFHVPNRVHLSRIDACQSQNTCNKVRIRIGVVVALGFLACVHTTLRIRDTKDERQGQGQHWLVVPYLSFALMNEVM